MRATSLFLLLPAVLCAQSPAPLSYEQDIAPILRSHCAGCHNDKDLEGKMSVETYAQLRKGGEDHADPIKPGDADNSFLMRSLLGQEKPTMPPKDEPRLPARDIETLKQWIASGAAGPARDESILRTMKVPHLAPATAAQAITAAAYSTDGSRFALARTTDVEIIDAASQAVLVSIKDVPGKISSVHFCAGDQQLIIASGLTGLTGVAQLRDVKSGALVREFGGHRDLLYDAEVSPDGKLLATAGYDRIINLWTLADGTLLRTIDVHKGAIFDLAWHQDNRVLAAASADETVKLWRVSDGVRLDTLNQAQGEMNAVLFTADGEHIVGAGKDRRIRLWKFVSRENPALNPVLISRFAHESPVITMAFSADGKFFLSSAEDRSLKLWSFPDLTLLQNFETQSDLCSVILSVPGKPEFLVARMDGSQTLISIPDQQPHAPDSAPVIAAPSARTPNATPTDFAEEATQITVPASIKGSIESPNDSDEFTFHALAGEMLTFEVNAARDKSKLDSKLAILSAEGQPVEQVVLQATRDSWFTFIGQNSDASDGFRMQYWAEMEINEYLYANGEVVKFWHYPRGPDSGFMLYPGSGKRQPCFLTTALTHALGETAYIVKPLPPGSQPTPNGLPVFRLPYENDDDPSRRNGADSLLLFTAPAEADYRVRIRDTRGFGGGDFHYTLLIRPTQPDFTVSIGGMNAKVSPGSGREITFQVERLEGFEGPIRIDFSNLPSGFTASSPVEIEAGQNAAVAVLMASADATSPDEAADKAVKITATAMIGGKEIVHELGNLGDLQIGAAAKLTVEILPNDDQTVVQERPGTPLHFKIHPGQTITARVRAKRIDFPGRIELGGSDAGRNLPHGLYVDNIGLNGLLIVEDQTERTFFITASPVARPSKRLFHLRATADDGQASPPVMIEVIE